jgi:hypothetical protein
MSDYRKNLLDARVAARNQAHSIANELQAKLIDAARPFIGKKIINADGTLAKSFESKLPPLPFGNGIRCYHDRYQTLLEFFLDVCKHVVGDSGCVYEKTSISVGILDGGILVSVREPEPKRTDWTADEIIAARQTAENLRRQAQDAENACGPFGLVDR